MRQRTLKPGFFKNEDLANLPMEVRVLFQGLWLVSDREGRFEDRPARLKVEIFPYDDLDVDDMLESLATEGFIRRYEVSGVRYGLVTTFKNHQHPHPKEPASVIPAPCNYTEGNLITLPDNEDALSRRAGSSGPSGSSDTGGIPGVTLPPVKRNGEPRKETAYSEPPMPQPPMPEWERKARAIWLRYMGGENEYIYPDLVDVYRRLGEAKFLAAWERYCKAQAANEGGRYASPRAFAQKPGPWLESEFKAERPQHSDPDEIYLREHPEKRAQVEAKRAEHRAEIAAKRAAHGL